MTTGKDGERSMLMIGIDDAARERFKEWVVSNPAYVAVVEKLAMVARQWLAAHPDAQLEWIDQGATFVTGNLDNRHVLGYLAKSPEAFELLAYMDEKTGRVASLMQARFALQHLGVAP